MSGPWSYSRIQVYAGCPRRYKLRYLDNLQPCREAAWYRTGRIFHELAEEYGRHCQAQRVVSDLAVARALARRWWGLEDDAARLFGDWAEWWQWNWDLTVADGDSVERWIERPLPDGSTFRGRVDLVLQDDGTLWIVDWKTDWSPFELEVRQDDPPVQLAVYAWLAGQVWTDCRAGVLQIVHVRSRSTSQWEVELPLRWPGDWVAEWVSRIRRDTVFEPCPGPRCSTCEYLLQCAAASPWAEALGAGGEELTAQSVGQAWLRLEAAEAAAREIRAAIGEWLKAAGPVDLGDGRTLGWWPPDYLGAEEQAPTLPRDRVAQFLGAAAEAGLDIGKLVTPDYEAIFKALQAQPQLRSCLEWRRPRVTLRAIRGPQQCC
jgi:putative RecB family exonuclease